MWTCFQRVKYKARPTPKLHDITEPKGYGSIIPLIAYRKRQQGSSAMLVPVYMLSHLRMPIANLTSSIVCCWNDHSKCFFTLMLQCKLTQLVAHFQQNCQWNFLEENNLPQQIYVHYDFWQPQLLVLCCPAKQLDWSDLEWYSRLKTSVTIKDI